MSAHVQLGKIGATRLLGHMDGMITALLKVKSAIGSVEYRYGPVDPRHHKKMARKAAELAPLIELRRILTTELDGNRAAYDAQNDK